MTLLFLFSTASRSQTRSSGDLTCDPEQPDRCSVYLRKGNAAPADGVLMTLPMAQAYKSSLDEAILKLDEERRYCSEQLQLQLATESAKEAQLEAYAIDREKALRAALEKEKQEALDASKKEAEGSTLGFYIIGSLALTIGVVAGGLLTMYLPH